MPRKRMIDPSFWRDEKIGACSYMERLLFQGMWSFAEDNGVGRANPRLLKSDIFPYDSLKESAIASALEKFADMGMVQLYEIAGQQYYFIINFWKHQKINRPSPSSLPLPSKDVSAHGTLTDASLSGRGGLTEGSPLNIREEKIREVKLREEKGSAFAPPTLEDVEAYCRERGSPVDPRRFFDYFTEGYWRDSKGNPVKNWKQKLITWEKHDDRPEAEQHKSFQELIKEEMARDAARD